MKIKDLKLATNMPFDDFCQWAKEIVVKHFLKDGLDGVSSAIWLIVEQASRNTEFGGGKKK